MVFIGGTGAPYLKGDVGKIAFGGHCCAKPPCKESKGRPRPSQLGPVASFRRALIAAQTRPCCDGAVDAPCCRRLWVGCNPPRVCKPGMTEALMFAKLSRDTVDWQRRPGWGCCLQCHGCPAKPPQGYTCQSATPPSPSTNMTNSGNPGLHE